MWKRLWNPSSQIRWLISRGWALLQNILLHGDICTEKARETLAACPETWLWPLQVHQFSVSVQVFFSMSWDKARWPANQELESTASIYFSCPDFSSSRKSEQTAGDLDDSVVTRPEELACHIHKSNFFIILPSNSWLLQKWDNSSDSKSEYIALVVTRTIPVELTWTQWPDALWCCWFHLALWLELFPVTRSS